jgi:hypothetical protein
MLVIKFDPRYFKNSSNRVLQFSAVIAKTVSQDGLTTINSRQLLRFKILRFMLQRLKREMVKKCSKANTAVVNQHFLTVHIL